jgi:hypothetical protein
MSNKKNNDKVVSDKHLELTCRVCGDPGYACDIRDDPHDDEFGLCSECDDMPSADDFVRALLLKNIEELIIGGYHK